MRDIRIRKKLHELDRAKASYSTTARTGDMGRLGKYPQFFDDTTSIVYSGSASINYPTTLRLGSRYLASDLTSSLTTTGSVNASAIDVAVPQVYNAEPWRGFKEDGLHEQSNYNEFFLTGTALEDVGVGFDSPLHCKTIIRFELPLSASSVLSPLTASTLYYDTMTQKFEQIQIYNQYAYQWMGANWGGAGTALPRENLMFGPLGKFSTDLTTTGAAVLWYQRPVPISSDTFFNSVASSSLTSISTNPSQTQQIRMENYISQPFLLEKCVIELPFMAGDGWLKDRTHCTSLGSPDISPANYADIGGPAITFSILNSIGFSRKELILSATIIPKGDDVRELSYYEIRDPITEALYSTDLLPSGFKSFSTPTVVVDARAPLTTSLTINCKPQIAIGAVGTGAGAYRGTSISVFNQTLAGRTKAGGLDTAGRSIFGRTANAPKISDLEFRLVNEDLYTITGTAPPYYFHIAEKVTDSPYLIYPKDNLIFALSKYRSAFVSRSFSYDTANPHNYAPGVEAAMEWIYQSASHDVAIGSGTIKVSLYGSLIKESVEFHDTLNTRLDTNQVHEAIGFEPTIDQFDVYTSHELSGSHHNQFKILTEVPYLKYGSAHAVAATGTMQSFNETIYSHVQTDSKPAAQVQPLLLGHDFTKFKYLNEIRKGSKNVILIGDELFYDSRLPDPKSVLINRNPQFRLTYFDVSYSNVRMIEAGTGSISTNQTAGAYDWWMTFPYESAYSSVESRFADELRNDLFSVITDGPNYTTSPQYVTYESMQIEVGGNSNRYIVGEFDVYRGITNGLGISEFVKMFYGIGKGRSSYANGFVMPRAIGTPSAKYGVCADIRGWRHGMISGFPVYTFAAFKRDHYGYMRDMLEQRVYTKFHRRGVGPLDSCITAKYVNVSGSNVSPYDTSCSNMSYECTSSLPYFDGNSRNR